MTATIERVKQPQLYSVDDGEMRLHLHSGQWRAWNSTARFIFMLAGTQGGKTSFGPHWLRREIQLCGPGDYMAVTSTFRLLKLKMLPEFLSLFRDHLNLGEWRAGDQAFVFSEYGDEAMWGEVQETRTRVIFGSATNSESLESATAKAAWLDEVGQDDFRLGSWEALRRRLSLNRGRVLAGTTIYNLGWLKSMVYDKWHDGDKRFDVIQFSSTVNPAFPQEEYEEAKQDLPDWKFRMFYGGLFTRPAGLIYSDYVDDYRENGGHLVRPFQIPPEWPRTGGLDFGGVNTARLLLATDPEANIGYIYDEYHKGGITTPEHAANAERATSGTNIRQWFGGAPSEDQYRRDWSAAGIHVQRPSIGEVSAGLDRVTRELRNYRLYIFDTCTELRDEFGTYSRVLDEMSNPTDKIKDKETFHLLDACRYLIIGTSQDELMTAVVG